MITRNVEGLLLQPFSPSFYRVVGLPAAIHHATPGHWFISFYSRNRHGDILERCHHRPFKSLNEAALMVTRALHTGNAS